MFTPFSLFLYPNKSTNVRILEEMKNLLVLLKRAAVVWRQRAKQRRSLAQMDSRSLADSGISATSADFELAQPFWQAPTALGRDALPEFLNQEEGPSALLQSLENYEEVKTKNGLTLLVRPMATIDRVYEREIFDNASDESRYSRFFRPVHYLDEKELARLTDTDNPDHLAWVGFIAQAEALSCVAVLHLVRSPKDPNIWEFSISVRDSHHGHGVGSALLDWMGERARNKGIDRLHGHVLETNHAMYEYAKHRGATFKRDYPGIFAFELSTAAMAAANGGVSSPLA